jgi:nucleotide-binding universal stress UspA family protein
VTPAAIKKRQPSPPFPTILCAVDGSRGSGQAVRQAISLARPGGAIRFMAVSYETGVGLAAMAGLVEERAQRALHRADRLAEKAGVSASVELRKGRSASDIVLREARGHDLMVVGSRGNSRAQGIVLGSVASKAAHLTAKPVLIARRSPDGDGFPTSLLLASDGAKGSWAAARATSRIAQARGSRSQLSTSRIRWMRNGAGRARGPSRPMLGSRCTAQQRGMNLVADGPHRGSDDSIGANPAAAARVNHGNDQAGEKLATGTISRGQGDSG